MSAPQVQSIEQIINDLNPAYQGQINVLNERRAQIPGMFNAQRTGLDAAKVQGFNQINNQATGRGMSFSGIPLDEQATYLSTKYLPGMQQLAQQENEQRSSLDEALARIDSERRTRAMDVRTDQQKRLEGYLAEQRQMAWEREKFAKEQAMQRAKMAQDAAQARSAQQSQGVSLDSIVRSYLNENSKNGKVSRQVWENAAAMAKSRGLSFGGKTGFASSYWSYAQHGNYKSGMEKYM